jgi:hypothetical protein
MKVFEQPSFTRFTELNYLKNAFRKAPKQVAGSPEAFEGLVAEFLDPSTGQSFTCSEISQNYRFKRFLVKILDGRIITIINNDDKFIIKE